MAWDLWSGVAAYSALSVGGTAWCIHGAVQKVLGSGATYDPGQEGVQVLQTLLESRLSVALLYNLAGSCFLLLSLATKTLFFGSLSAQEGQKLAERLLNYILFKVLFLIAAVPLQKAGGLWLLWFAILGFLKIFAGLARDRFERLCASPRASLATHARTAAVLFLVLACNALLISLWAALLRGVGLSTALLLMFEAVIITIDTCQTLAQYGVHLAEACVPLAGGGESDVTLGQSGGGGSGPAAWSEWRRGVLFHVNFACDLLSLVLTFAHYAHVWRLHGLGFQLVDGLLFLNLRALFTAIVGRVRAAARYVRALRSLRAAFPDATPEQLKEFGDDCAICKEPMAAAKRLPCKHLFHLSCLRSWLDQMSPSLHSCPTCRSPLLGGDGKPAAAPSPALAGRATPLDGGREQEGVEQGATRQQSEDSGGSGGNSSSTSGGGSGGGGVNLQADGGILGGLSSDASVRLDWWWPFGPPEGGVEGPEMLAGMAAPMMRSGALRWRGRSQAPGGGWGAARGAELPWGEPRMDIEGEQRPLLGGSAGASRTESMVQQVEEILPQVPRELIVQDLRRTNSVAVTVSRLLGDG